MKVEDFLNTPLVEDALKDLYLEGSSTKEESSAELSLGGVLDETASVAVSEKLLKEALRLYSQDKSAIGDVYMALSIAITRELDRWEIPHL